MTKTRTVAVKIYELKVKSTPRVLSVWHQHMASSTSLHESELNNKTKSTLIIFLRNLIRKFQSVYYVFLQSVTNFLKFFIYDINTKKLATVTPECTLASSGVLSPEPYIRLWAGVRYMSVLTMWTIVFLLCAVTSSVWAGKI